MNRQLAFPFISNTLTIHGFHANVVGPGWFYPDHSHTSFELLYCWGGEATEWLDDYPILFERGDWLLIPPGVKHKTLNKNKDYFTYISLLFDTDNIHFLKKLQTITTILAKQKSTVNSEIPQYLKMLDHIIYQDLLYSNVPTNKHLLEIQLGFQSCILLILKDIISILSQDSEQPDITYKKANLYEITVANQIEELLIKAIYDSTYTIGQISKRIGLHRNRCNQIFSKVYGYSPQQYVSQKKLLLVKEQLLQTDRSIESIAFQFGFSSLSHFSRQFKRWTGQAPSAYRPAHRVLSGKFDARI